LVQPNGQQLAAILGTLIVHLITSMLVALAVLGWLLLAHGKLATDQQKSGSRLQVVLSLGRYQTVVE